MEYSTGAELPQGSPGNALAMHVRWFVADVMSIKATRGRVQDSDLSAAYVAAGIKYCGSIFLSLHGISRHTALRPLPLTHPFSLKSNWPTIRPS